MTNSHIMFNLTYNDGILDPKMFFFRQIGVVRPRDGHTQEIPVQSQSVPHNSETQIREGNGS